MTTELITLITDALEDVKAKDVVVMDVSDLTDVTDHLVVASGSSARQVKALANNVVETLKKKGHQPLGVEGMESPEWILVDMGDVVVHVMLPETRQFYDLEKLWSVRPNTDETSKQGK